MSGLHLTFFELFNYGSYEIVYRRRDTCLVPFVAYGPVYGVDLAGLPVPYILEHRRNYAAVLFHGKGQYGKGKSPFNGTPVIEQLRDILPLDRGQDRGH